MSDDLSAQIIKVEKAPGTKCERCRFWREEVGCFSKWPELCARCAQAEEEAAKGSYLLMVYQDGVLLQFKALRDELKEEFLTWFYNSITKKEKDRTL